MKPESSVPIHPHNLNSAMEPEAERMLALLTSPDRAPALTVPIFFTAHAQNATATLALRGGGATPPAITVFTSKEMLTRYYSGQTYAVRSWSIDALARKLSELPKAEGPHFYTINPCPACLHHNPIEWTPHSDAAELRQAWAIDSAGRFAEGDARLRHAETMAAANRLPEALKQVDLVLDHLGVRFPGAQELKARLSQPTPPIL